MNLSLDPTIHSYLSTQGKINHVCLHKDFSSNVHNAITHKGPKVETDQMIINCWGINHTWCICTMEDYTEKTTALTHITTWWVLANIMLVKEASHKSYVLHNSIKCPGKANPNMKACRVDATGWEWEWNWLQIMHKKS